MSADLDVDIDVGKLVEPDRVHRSIYTDPTIFQLEMERIFEHTWIYVGHDSQVPDPGWLTSSRFPPRSSRRSRRPVSPRPGIS